MCRACHYVHPQVHWVRVVRHSRPGLGAVPVEPRPRVQHRLLLDTAGQCMCAPPTCTAETFVDASLGQRQWYFVVVPSSEGYSCLCLLPHHTSCTGRLPSDVCRQRWAGDVHVGSQAAGGRCHVLWYVDAPCLADVMAHTASTTWHHATLRTMAAQCLADLSLSVFGRSWQKRDAALIISYMDVLSVIIYLFCIVWVQQKEKAAKAARGQVTAGKHCSLLSLYPRTVCATMRWLLFIWFQNEAEHGKFKG